MGRRSKLTPQLQAELVNLIAAGNYDATAASAVGISSSTFYRWLEQGERASSGRYREFWEAVTRARARAEVEAVSVLKTAAQSGDWRAAVEWLARKHPDRWGRAKPRQDAEEDTGPTEITVVIGGHKKEASIDPRRLSSPALAEVVALKRGT